MKVKSVVSLTRAEARALKAALEAQMKTPAEDGGRGVSPRDDTKPATGMQGKVSRADRRAA